MRSIKPDYIKIKTYILKQIQKGAYKPGDKIPSENDLVKKFNVSRMTVNRAIRELTAEGLLIRLQGKGTYVAYENEVSEMLELKGVIDEIIKMGKEHRLEVITVKKIKATLQIAKKMNLKEGQDLFYSVFLHYADEEPFQLEERYVNSQIVPNYDKVNFSNETAHQYLMRTTPLTEVEHIVEAILPNKFISNMLKITPKTPCLQLSRRTWLNQYIVTYVKFIASGEKYKIGTKFKYSKDGKAIRESI